MQEELRVDTGCVFLNASSEAILEDRLRDGDKDRAAKGLEEGDARCADGHVNKREDGLYHEDAALKADADAGAGEDLVPEPFCEGRVDVVGCD